MQQGQTLNRTSMLLRAVSLCLTIVSTTRLAAAAPSLLDIVKSGGLAPDSCHVTRTEGDCSKVFAVLASGQYQQVASIFSSISYTESYAKLFPKCAMAKREEISHLAVEDKRDPLYDVNLTDHINFLPTSFRLFPLSIKGKRERVLIVSAYVGNVDVKVQHSIAYLLNSKKPCQPQFISLAGYPSYGAGEGQQLDVIRIDGVPYVLSITQNSPGRTAARFQLTQVPNSGAGREQYKYILFATK